MTESAEEVDDSTTGAINATATNITTNHDDDDDDDVVAVSPRVTSVSRRSTIGESSSKRHAIERSSLSRAPSLSSISSPTQQSVPSPSSHRLSNVANNNNNNSNNGNGGNDASVSSQMNSRDSLSIMPGTPFGLSQTLPLLPSPLASSASARGDIPLTSVSLPPHSFSPSPSPMTLPRLASLVFILVLT